MTITFRPGVRESVGLLIGLAGGTGSGKTFSAMRLAHGIAGDNPFAIIDTEARRALHYADRFKFDHAELHPPFRPDTYADAIAEADKAGYPVIVVDSVSHVWAGEGGVLDWAEEELDRMAGADYKKRESCKMASWIKPKMAHKQFVQRLLQCKAHLILCFRAEEKLEMSRNEHGKMEIIKRAGPTGKDGWFPVCEKALPFELTCSLLLMMTEPGYPHAIKVQEQHLHLFPPGAPIDEAAGKRIAEWAAGGAPAKTSQASTATDTLRSCRSLDELALAWKALTPAERKVSAKIKDAVKARLQAELEEPILPPGPTEASMLADIAVAQDVEKLDYLRSVNDEKFAGETKEHIAAAIRTRLSEMVHAGKRA